MTQHFCKAMNWTVTSKQILNDTNRPTNIMAAASVKKKINFNRN